VVTSRPSQLDAFFRTYNYIIANRKQRKKKKNQLERDKGTIVGEDNLKFYITEYYKKNFLVNRVIMLSL
jgi:hypothetical protein